MGHIGREGDPSPAPGRSRRHNVLSSTQGVKDGPPRDGRPRQRRVRPLDILDDQHDPIHRRSPTTGSRRALRRLHTLERAKERRSLALSVGRTFGYTANQILASWATWVGIATGPSSPSRCRFRKTGRWWAEPSPTPTSTSAPAQNCSPPRLDTAAPSSPTRNPDNDTKTHRRLGADRAGHVCSGRGPGRGARVTAELTSRLGPLVEWSDDAVIRAPQPPPLTTR